MGTMYIRLQAYVYIYWYIYIYIYIYIHTRRVSIRFVLYACHSNHAGSSPHGGPFHFHFFIFFKNPKTKLKSFRISRPSRNMLQNDGDFTRTEKGSPFFFSTGALGRAFLVKLPFYHRLGVGYETPNLATCGCG